MRHVEELARTALAYLSHSWRGIVAVTAIVTIGHHFHGLDPVDTYAFLVISHFLGSPPAGETSRKVVVASIDPVAHERDYHERSPLDRCVLHRHLKTVYETEPRPSLVVVDLDLSPAPVAGASEGESSCEEALYGLVADRTRARTNTVLMDPFEASTEEGRQRAKLWKARMVDAGVRFGHALVPSDWGLAVRHHCDGRSLAVVAYLAEPRPARSPRRSNCLSEGHAKSFIDPRHYLAGIAVIPLASASFDARIADAMKNIPPPKDDPRRVVFFGGGWGESDTYLTPVGELYGVEVHAAAYLSLDDPPRAVSHLASATLDLLIASVVGLVFSRCWRGYFAAAFARSRTRRECAVGYLVGLGALVGGFSLGLAVGAWWLLSRGLWLSPIAIVVGMLIHAFVESLQEAVAAAREGAPAHGPARLSRRVARFLWGDVAELYRRKARTAAMVLALKRAAWLFVAGFGLWLVLS